MATPQEKAIKELPVLPPENYLQLHRGLLCPYANLVIEIDGGQHYSEEGQAKDALHDRHLANLGLDVMRISAREILKNTEGVLEAIYQRLP